MGHATFKVGDIAALIGDNAGHEPSKGHRAGYNGIWDFQHKNSTRSLFVPTYAGLNLEHIFNGETEFEGGDIFFEPRRAPMTFKKLNDQQVPVVVVTNQSVVGRGLCSEEELDDIHLALRDLLGKNEAHITRFYFCPHHPSAAMGAYRLDCKCRKPKPGMLRQAARELGIDLVGSVMVGDNFTDIQAGLSVGCRTVLISDSDSAEDGRQVVETSSRPDHTAAGLDSAIDWILEALTTGPAQLNPLSQGRT